MSFKAPWLRLFATIFLVSAAACSDDGNNGNGDPAETDADMDGVPADDDCDDMNAMLGAIANDADCDGVTTATDCDDTDDMLGSNANDADCDGVVTADDCDDTDDMSLTVATDADCDGIPTADDCDDMDDMSTAVANDADCDGIATAADCDDMDAMSNAVANDADCDGVLTAADCNDMDAMSTTVATDADCDGVLTAADCDDTDMALGAIMNDLDCDGALNPVDECPEDAEFVEAAPPAMSRRFPSQFSATTANELDVSGSVVLGCGGTTLDTITADVGGAMVAVQTQQIAPDVVGWTVPVTLALDADNIVTVTALDSRSRSGTTNATIQQYQAPQPPPTESLESSQGIAVDPMTDIAYVSDEALPGVYATDLSTGITTIFSATGVGTGPDFTNDLEGGIALDADNSRLLVTDDGADSVVAVDLATGNRTVLSGPNSPGPQLGTPYGIVVSNTTNLAYLVDTTADGVFTVDLVTGSRTIISSPNVGSGPVLTSPRDIDLDLANNRALVVGVGVDALVEVDLTTGDRTELSGPNVGMGLAFDSIRGLTFDAINNLVLVADAGNGFESVVAVNLTNGDRTEISGPNVGATLDVGADFDSTRGIYIDQMNGRLIVVDDQITSLVEVDPGNGNRSLIAPAAPPLPGVGFGPTLLDPTGIVIDDAANAIYVADDTQTAIFQIDLATGARTIFADQNSMGTVLESPRGLGIDAANSRLLVPDNGLDAIVAVDLMNGAGSIVSDDDSPDDMSETFGSPRGRVQVGPNGMFGFVADTSRDSVFRFDLMSGERTTLAEAGNGVLEGIQTVDLDAAGGRLIVTVASTGNDDVLDGVLAIDIGTGVVTPIATRSTDDPALGSGPDMTNPRGLALDLANDRAIVFDSDLDAVLSVSLSTGDRTIVSSEATGNGDFLVLDGNNTNSVALDAERQIVFVANETSDQVVLIDLVTGAQVVVSR